MTRLDPKNLSIRDLAFLNARELWDLYHHPNTTDLIKRLIQDECRHRNIEVPE